MLKASVRRSKIEIILCRRRLETMSNLALELGVSKRTIQRDVDILSQSIPIYTTRGNHGGVCLLGDYKKERQFMYEHEIQTLSKVIAGETDCGQVLDQREKELLSTLITKYSSLSSQAN